MSVNDFKRGAEAQSRVHYAFMRKQGEATAELGKRIIKKIDQLGNIVNFLIDELNQQEMDRVFGICSSLDIGVLDSSDQIKLLSYLKAMTTRHGQTTQQQLDYFFAVKRYLNIGNVADTIDFNAISELDLSRSEMKAFLECVCEFLFLRTGTKAFLDVFKEEIDCFGFNDKIVGEIVSTIEKTYNFFGVQGIIEHYSLEPIKHEDPKCEPIIIPFFKIPVTIVYTNKDKESERMADLLKARIDSRLDTLEIPHEVGTCTNLDYKNSKATIEKEGQVIFIGIPPEAKATSKNLTWAYDEYGMKFGTEGRKSIINVSSLRKNEYTGFIELAKLEQEKLRGNKIPDGVENSEMSFLKETYSEATDDAISFIAHVLGTVVMSPLIVLGTLLDAGLAGAQSISNLKAKDQITLLQYTIAFEKFLDSKINPYTVERK